MKTTFKKFALLCAVVLGIAAGLFAAPMNPRKGYKDLDWGSSARQVISKGYNLIELDSTLQEIFKKQYEYPVTFYEIKVKEKNIKTVWVGFYNDKLIDVREVYNTTAINLKDLKARYGSDLIEGTGNVIYRNGSGENYNLVVLKGENNCVVQLFDPEVFFSIMKKHDSKIGSSGFAAQFDQIAVKLLQDPKNGTRATYAFLDFSTDDNNSLVEKYITDALTEAIFNTGKVKIIERANIEKIIKEQKFQSSGLVNESTAASIGNIAGVEYVCYGTVKEIDTGYTVSARVVDVESGEICAMSRTNVTKDSYLSSNSKSSGGYKTKTTTSIKKPAESLWTCTQSRNEFDGYTTYTFILKGPEVDFLFMGYDKYDNPSKSKVRAGVNWKDSEYSTSGTYDFKTETKGVITKRYSTAPWSTKTGWVNVSNNGRFYFTYNKGESARQLLTLFDENDYLTIRHSNEVRRFMTKGFWETIQSYGITKEEIDNAIANEEF